MGERLLLNFLLILVPVFGYQLIMFHGSYQRDSKPAQYLMGILTGASAVLCMTFPIVTGTHFLWDMRWTAFFLAVTYGGFRGGGICAAILLFYRASLGGTASWLVSVVDVAILLPAMLKFVTITQHRRKSKQIIRSLLLASFGYLFVETSIFFYFVYQHKPSLFLNQGALFFMVYGIFTVFAFVFPVMLIENIFTQIEIRKALLQAEKMNLVGDLASSFAHEIRNPLTVAKGFVQFIGESLDHNEKLYTEMVVTELNRAENIITDYLSLAKPQVRNLQLVAVDETLTSLAQIMSPFATVHNVNLTCETEPGLYIYADAQHFKQMTMNIVKNAIESIQSEGYVHIVATKLMEKVQITIADNGVGMTEEQIQRLGKPFYSTKSKGTGLGLMVTFRLVEEMRGTVHFESTHGVGTKVIMQFPRQLLSERDTSMMSNKAHPTIFAE